MLSSWDGEPDPAFDADFAEGFIGRTLLVGITHVGVGGEVTHQEQMHGVIRAASAHGIDVELGGANDGVMWRMPPFLEELQAAAPGIYRLRATGESVTDPDFLFTVTIRRDSQH